MWHLVWSTNEQIKTFFFRKQSQVKRLGEFSKEKTSSWWWLSGRLNVRWMTQKWGILKLRFYKITKMEHQASKLTFVLSTSSFWQFPFFLVLLFFCYLALLLSEKEKERKREGKSQKMKKISFKMRLIVKSDRLMMHLLWLTKTIMTQNVNRPNIYISIATRCNLRPLVGSSHSPHPENSTST